MIKIISSFVLLILIHLLILTQLQFTAWPEMFSYSYLINNNFLLYKDIGLPYQPLLPLFLSGVFGTFGYGLLTLKVITWLIILFIDLLIFITSIKIIGRKPFSLLPVGIYILLQPLTSGNMLWFDLATTPFILLSLMSVVFLKEKKWFFSFLFLAIATFIKQQAGLIFIPFIIYLIFSREKVKIFSGLLGILIPSFVVAIYVLANNILNDYLFWTFEVPVIWYPSFPGYSRWPTSNELLITLLIFLPGIILMMKSIKKSKQLQVAALFFLSTFLTSFPRFDFFRMQPTLAIYILLIILSFSQKIKVLALLIIPICLAAGILFVKSLPTLHENRFYGNNEQKLSQQLTNLSGKDDKVYLLGVDSINYVLSNRVPSKPWIDNYVWYLEIPGMQEKVIEGLKKTPPKVILLKKAHIGNWYGLGTYRPKKIVEYITLNYEKINEIYGEIEIWTLKRLN